MRRPGLLWAAAPAALAAVLLGLGTGIGAVGGEREPRPPVPRVCWYSDYENARLSNACDYDGGSGRWMLEVDGRRVPAEGVPLPEANLCHYLHGQSCPDRGRPG